MSCPRQPLKRLADARNNPRNKPLRLAHLNHGDDCAILLEGGEGPARVKSLRHGALHRFASERQRCLAFAARPIASAHLRTLHRSKTDCHSDKLVALEKEGLA